MDLDEITKLNDLDPDHGTSPDSSVEFNKELQQELPDKEISNE